MYISADCVADLADDGNLDAADGHLDPTSPSADGAADGPATLSDDDLLMIAQLPSLIMMLTARSAH